MAAGPALLDINTGLPVSQNIHRQPAFELTTTTTPGRTDLTQQTQVSESQQTQTSFQNILNTTPEALRSLDNLIRSLSDRPRISDEEVNARAPSAQAKYTREYGWTYVDPLTGRSVSENDIIKFNQQRRAERQKIQQEGGVIPGGTAEQKETQEGRKTEISRTREQQGKYSKEAAFSDAQFLIDKAIRDSLEKAMPQITAASEGAGTSKGTFRALATQEAVTKGAVEGGALGAQLGIQYGQIFNQLEAMLIEMTKQDPNSPANLLLQALQASKGMVQVGTTGTSVSGRQVSQTQGQSQVGPTSQQQITSRDYSLGASSGAPTGLPELASARIIELPGSRAQPLQTKPIGYAVSDKGTFDTNAAYDSLTEDRIFDEY